MSTTTSSGPSDRSDRSDHVRDDVERVLHGIVDVTLALPLAVWSRAWRCARHQVDTTGDRLAAPVQLVRSLFELATGGVDVEPALTRPETADGRGVARPRADVPAAEPAPPDAPSAADRAADELDQLDQLDELDELDELDDVIASDELPIEQYESLAASQVVARLGGLSRPELEQVQAFESATRGRRTVLGRIERLLADA